MIAVIVPAHDEADCIQACLASIQVAARCPLLRNEAVRIVVALDACTDDTGLHARAMGATTVELQARNVGQARWLGAHVALQAGARWLAFTDADTLVAPNWLSAQMALQCDAVCGTVQVDDWGAHSAQTRARHDAAYLDADGHGHIHGANLGVCALAYQDVGGFPALSSSEDVALVTALQQNGACVVFSAAPRVSTSARRAYRAPLGFGATLERLHHDAHS
ncbi:MAG: glycosyltransferase [Pseudomonadota bacterium]